LCSVNLPAETTQSQVKCLRDTILVFHHLITEALGNYAQTLDASDIEDGEGLGYIDQTFTSNTVWKSDMFFFFKKFKDS
jgi:hypothetical protein